MSCNFPVVCEFQLSNPSKTNLICFSRCSGWKRLIDHPLTLEERISLITDIFSDPDETEIVKDLCGEDAQSFVDEMYQVTPSVILELSFFLMSSRCWTA